MRNPVKRMAFCAALIAVILAGLASCQRADPKTEVRAAIQEHLKQNAHLIPASFTTHFESISVRGETAEALVKYQSKTVSNLAVEVSYGLKKINGQWQVVSSSSAGGQMTSPANPHQGAAMDQTPPPAGPPNPVPSH